MKDNFDLRKYLKESRLMEATPEDYAVARDARDEFEYMANTGHAEEVAKKVEALLRNEFDFKDPDSLPEIIDGLLKMIHAELEGETFDINVRPLNN